MKKTLLAATLLSTGLFAGGVVGTEDVKTDEKIKVTVADKDGNITYKEIDGSEISKNAVPATPKGDVKEDARMDNLKSNEGNSISMSADGTTSFSQDFNAPKDAVPATSKEDVK
ncbi:hypothetical protein ILT06_21235 [Bacillus sp. 17RED48]|uniref:Alpha-ketoglutarate permease n=1 Tax=Bacillus wiedmannii TaxID=1890302 RepID=A0A1A9PZD5_9BACI|nr:hypothetical protein [Bacillus sp. 17RED48]OAK08890.1 hypothetical protein A6280_25180 [Bacillus wiedmannii]OUB85068.1 hypothetical protein BK788_13130 [Bacillus thuringiensis serovar sinensis]PEM49901.1 hypothetical protein CN611_24140 [Bacillus wiedmannii]PGA91568.1 hypothetical protein COL92_30645 [Bacillus wiedmannii]